MCHIISDWKLEFVSVRLIKWNHPKPCCKSKYCLNSVSKVTSNWSRSLPRISMSIFLIKLVILKCFLHKSGTDVTFSDVTQIDEASFCMVIHFFTNGLCLKSLPIFCTFHWYVLELTHAFDWIRRMTSGILILRLVSYSGYHNVLITCRNRTWSLTCASYIDHLCLLRVLLVKTIPLSLTIFPHF